MGKNLWLVVIVAGAVLSGTVISGNNHPKSAPVYPGAIVLQESEKPAEKTGVVELGDIKPPRLIKAVTPRYPESARRLGFEGTVIIEATTDLKGRVASTRVLKSVPPLDQAAVKAVKQWVYEPLIIDGRPRRIVFTVTIRFSLNYGGSDKALADAEPPKLIHRVVPVYPPEAKKAGLEGTVVLGATIDGEGKVTDVKVLESVPGLDQAAVDAVKQWQYGPVWVDNHPVIYAFTVTVRFALKQK
jgi:protein TonB